MFFWLLHNPSSRSSHRNIDDIIPLDVLGYTLSAGGILAPTNDGQPKFESAFIPIHEMKTVHESAATLIRTQEPCILSLPPSLIHGGLINNDYRDHYERPLKMDAAARDRSMHHRLSEFYKSSSISRALSNTTCLFPAEHQPIINNHAVCTAQCSLVEAGTRLVSALYKPKQQLHKDPPITSSTTSLVVTKTKGSSKSPLKQAYLVRKDGSVMLSKTPPAVDTMSLEEFQRRNSVKQAKLNKPNQYKPAGLGQSAVMQPRYKPDTYVVNMYDSFKDVGKMYSTDWSKITSGFDGNSTYLEELRFLEQNSKHIRKGDQLIMLYDVNRVFSSLFNCSHLLYTVDTVIGSKTYLRLSESMRIVGQDHIEGFFPEKILMHIKGAYILYEGASGAVKHQSVSQSPPPAMSLTQGHNEPTIDDDTSSNDDDGSSDSDKSQSDELGEKRSTKTPSIRTGRMTFKVLGKTAIRDDLQNAIAICNMVEEGRLEILLAPLGVYGHTMTPTNIINGIFRHGMEDSDFNVENLNVPVKQNKALVQSQAWTPYKNLYTNMAYQRYQLVANMTEDSIISVHFLQLKLAVERNYVLANWNDWVMHLEGYKQFVHELYGTIYSTCVQNMVLEVQSQRLGERHNVTYLDVLTNAFRTQLYHFASRDSSFKAPGQQEVRHPQKMTPTEWVDVMNALWTDFKGKLTVQQEMSFNYSQSQFKTSKIKLQDDIKCA